MFTALLAMSVLTAAGASAKVSPIGQPNGPQQVIRPIPSRSPEELRISGLVAFGAESGVARSLSGVNYKVTPSDPETMARQYLSANASKLSLGDTQLGDLFVRATRATPAGTVVRFEQRHQGIPVLAPDVVVTIDGQSKVTFVMNGYETGILLDSVTPSLEADFATDVVMSELGITDTPAYKSTRLVIVPDGKA